MQRTLRLAYALLGLALLIALCATLGLDELRKALAGASPVRLGAFLCLSTTVFGGYALRWRVILAFLGGPPLPLRTLLLARAAGHATGTLVPSGQLSGEPVRAFLLRRHGVDWATALLAVGIDRLVEMTVAAVVGPIYVAVFLYFHQGSPRAARWVLGSMAAGVVGLAWIYWNGASRRGLLAFVARSGVLRALPTDGARERFAAFLRSRSFPLALFLSLAIEALLVAELWTLTRAFGLDLPLAVIGPMLVGMGVAQLAPIPGAIGSLEAAQVGVVRLAGGAASLGLAAGLLVRLRESLWVIVGAGYLYAQGLGRAAAISENVSRMEAKELSARSS
jgi:uncharacterized membrane protein YbhN (UPF0104 family)